jgi:hypothetical protein
MGLLTAAGRLSSGLAPITHYFRSLPLNANDEVVVGSGPIAYTEQGIPFNAAGEVVGLQATSPSDYGPGATPYGPNGEIEADPTSPIAFFYQGVPYTANGVYAASGAGGAPAIVSKDFTLTPDQVSPTTAGYRLSPLAGSLAPDDTYAGDSISLVLAQETDEFSITPLGGVPFPGISGNLAVTLGVYSGPTRLVLEWDIDRYYLPLEPGIYNYMVGQIGVGTLLRLSGAPSGTA